jgi:hypothetical protein
MSSSLIHLAVVTATASGLVNEPDWDVKLPDSNLGFGLMNDQLRMFLLSSNVFVCLLDFSIKL